MTYGNGTSYGEDPYPTDEPTTDPTNDQEETDR